MAGDEQPHALPGSHRGRLTEIPQNFSRHLQSRIRAFLLSRRACWGALLIVATFLAYMPAWHGGFVWDDDYYVQNNTTLKSAEGLRKIWFQPDATPQYYPLTFTTFWAEYHLWQSDTLGYHLINLSLHALNAILFWLILRKLGVKGAWLAGAIFALHPLMVESAGWITERKNVLSLAFYLGSLLAYGGFVDFWKEGDAHVPGASTAASKTRGRAMFMVSLILFLAALLAKTTAFSLPPALVLIAWWKHGRLRWKRDLLPLVPFFALALGMSLVTAWLEKHSVGAHGSEWNLSFPQRAIIAGRVIWFYVSKLVWPANLSFVYPRWKIDASSFSQWIWPVTALGTLLALWLARARIGRGPATAAFFFVGTLFPVLGFMNVYFMRYAFVCDHWVYLSSLGLIALGAALAWRAAEFLRARVALGLIAAVILPVLAVLTWRQAGMYASLEALWETTIAKNPVAWLPHNNLGNIFLDEGQVDRAIVQFQEALKVVPSSAESHYNLGNALLLKGAPDEAIPEFERAIQLQPDFVKAFYNLGLALARKDRVEEAIVQFQKATEIQPDFGDARYNLGIALLRANRASEAIRQFKKTLELHPRFAKAFNNLGVALLQKGRLNESIDSFESAIKLQPDYTMALNNLVRVLLQAGRGNEAIQALKEFLSRQPQNIVMLNNLSWLLATSPEGSLRDGISAITLAEHADQLSGGSNRVILATLAAAYAEAGRFPEATAAAAKAQQLASAQGKSEEATLLTTRIKQYQAGFPFRDAELTNSLPATDQH